MADISTNVNPADKMNRALNMAVAAADPKVRTKVLQRTWGPLKEGITSNYGHILDIAPVVDMIPIAPLPGKENETLSHLNESVKWVQSQPGIQSALVYELAAGDERRKVPTFLVVITADDNSVMQHLKNDPKAQKFQKVLMNASGGKSATDRGIRKINSMLIGL